MTVAEPRLRSRLTLLLIVAVFVAPIGVAWLYSSGKLALPDRDRVNRGQLVVPPIDLSAEEGRTGLAPLFSLQPSEWAVVLLAEDPVADGAERTLDDLLTLRELLGQGAVRVSVHLITAQPFPVPRHASRAHVDPEVLAFLMRRLREAGMAAGPAIVLVDWRHQLMMRYPAKDHLPDIQRDLKRLLRASAIR